MLPMPRAGCDRHLALRTWMSVIVAFSFLRTGSLVLAQNDSSSTTTWEKEASELRLGPFDLHPRLSAGLIYDDNLLLATANKEADAEWVIHPGIQAVAGDKAALVAYRDQNTTPASLSPGNLIVQEPEDRPGKLFILDYGLAFQIFDRYTANNSIDEFASLDLLWPMARLILALKQDYQLQKMAIIEADQRTTIEYIPTTLSAAYQVSDKTSVESDLRRFSINYDSTGLTGYTEYSAENWLNYEVGQNLHASIGLLTGWDAVTNHQDQTYEQFRARARYHYTEKLIFDASVGGELRQFENGNPQALSPVFDASLEYSLAEGTWLRVAGFRQQYAAIFNGYNYATTAATVEVRQRITDRCTANFSVGYYNVNYTTITGPSMTHTDRDYLGKIDFEAKIFRHLTGEIYYQFLDRQSHFNGDLKDNQTGLRLTLSY